jgi:hypothetical protein
MSDADEGSPWLATTAGAWLSAIVETVRALLISVLRVFGSSPIA